MAVDRVDIRAKLDPDMHAALKAVCDVARLDIGEYVEALVVADVTRRVHEATVLAQRVERLGITGNQREQPGTAGNAAECPGACGRGGRR